jgi:hypothetical protein
MTNREVLRVVPSEICSALDTRSIGSKVTKVAPFYAVMDQAVVHHDFSKDRVPGQGFLVCPELVPFVSAGVGPRSKNPEDYVLREHRGIVGAYLKREFAAPVTGVALVVYTKEAYLFDPDVTSTAEAEKVRADLSITHLLVAVLAFAGPEASPLPPYRLVWNLGGGNREAETYTADEIRAKAKAAIEYDNLWVPVAD